MDEQQHDEGSTKNGQPQEPVPVIQPTWWEVAAALFPNSRAMTHEERRELDARVWADAEPITVTDDPPVPHEERP